MIDFFFGGEVLHPSVATTYARRKRAYIPPPRTKWTKEPTKQSCQKAPNSSNRQPYIRTKIKPKLDSSIRRHQPGHLNSECSKQRTCTKAQNSCSRAPRLHVCACALKSDDHTTIVSPAGLQTHCPP